MSRVVLYVAVHVSRETIVLERSAVADGASETKIGLKGGGMGLDDMFAGRAGTSGEASTLSARVDFNDGRKTKVGVIGTARLGRGGGMEKG